MHRAAVDPYSGSDPLSKYLEDEDWVEVGGVGLSLVEPWFDSYIKKAVSQKTLSKEFTDEIAAFNSLKNKEARLRLLKGIDDVGRDEHEMEIIKAMLLFLSDCEIVRSFGIAIKRLDVVKVGARELKVNEKSVIKKYLKLAQEFLFYSGRNFEDNDLEIAALCFAKKERKDSVVDFLKSNLKKSDFVKADLFDESEFMKSFEQVSLKVKTYLEAANKKSAEGRLKI